MLEPILGAIIRCLPENLAFAATRKLGTRPPRLPVQGLDAAALSVARQRYDLGWPGNAVWSWGEGPNVVLVHGWGGRGSQMAQLAIEIAKLGYCATIFDVAGHGGSPEPIAKMEYFLRDSEAINARLGDVYAWVGHSVGGLGMMAAHRDGNLTGEKFICICSPSHPFPPVRRLKQALGVGPGVISRYQHYLAHQFRTSWDQLKSGWAFANAGANLLLCYDEKDRFVDHSEGNRIQSFCPDAKLVKTASFGHTRILASAEVAHTIGRFINQPASSAP